MKLKAVLYTLFVAMLPVVELRGALPIGVAQGLGPLESLFISIVGNMLPVPIIILFVRRVFAWLRTKSVRLESFVSSLERRARDKAELVHRYELLGLFVLVAIPLPGTGAWTGALVAALLDMRLRRAVPTILMGVAAAGIIVLCLTYGVGALVGHF